MKPLVLLMTLALLTGIDIGKINAVKREAREAYQNGDYQRAAERYQYLIDSLGIREDEVMLNLANARFRLNDTTSASGLYRQLTGSNQVHVRSRAYQQLGVLSTRQGQLEAAAGEFRSALQADPANQEARFNYEAVMKKLAEQKKKDQQNKQNKDKQNKDQKDQKDQKDKKNEQNKDKQDQQKKDQKEKQDQQDQDQKKKEQEQKEQEKKEQQKKEQDQQKKEQEQKPKNFDPNRMKNMKISEDKAKMILEAMKNNEIQYLQQNRRKATKPKDKSKPDW